MLANVTRVVANGEPCTTEHFGTAQDYDITFRVGGVEFEVQGMVHRGKFSVFKGRIPDEVQDHCGQIKGWRDVVAVEIENQVNRKIGG